MLSNKKTLKNAAWIIIALGVVETLFLINAIQTKTNYSGGAVIYIIVGLFVLKKDKFAYKVSQFLFTFLVLAAPSVLLLYLIIFIQVITASKIPISYSLIDYNSLYAIVHVGVAGYLVMLLHHPNTRKELSLDEYDSNIKTLFIPIKRFVIISVMLLVFASLVTGPSILNNPYKQIAEGLSNDTSINSKVGSINSLELLRTNTHNWVVYSYWNIRGEKGKGVYYTKLDTKSNLDINEYGRKSASSDCQKSNSNNQSASLKYKPC